MQRLSKSNVCALSHQIVKNIENVRDGELTLDDMLEVMIVSTSIVCNLSDNPINKFICAIEKLKDIQFNEFERREWHFDK